MSGLFSFMRDIFEDSREILLLSDTYCSTPTGLESSTSQFHLQLPEVWAPAQYLVEAGLRPALAQRLSSTYMDFVDRYRKTCQLHFARATHGGHLTKYHREVFIVLFRRTTQVWGSQIVSIVRAQLCQTGVLHTTVRPGRVDVRVDDATKAEIIAKLGLKATYLTSDTTVTSPRANVTSRLEEVLEQTHVISTDAVDSRSMLPWSPLISSRSNYYDPFSHVAPQTCFPVPYPPPPPESCLPRNTLPTSFISPTPSRVVRSLASHSLDMSTLTNLFERMNTTALEANARIPRSHKVSFVPDSDKTKLLPPFLSPSVADNSTKPHLTSVESIASPTKPTNTPRRRKIASLPTRRSKTSACLSPPRIDLAEATSYSTSRDVEETPSTHTHAKQLVPALPSPYTYTAEAPCFATPKYSTPRQRRVHTLRKTIPRPQTVPQNQTLNLTTAEETSYNISRFPPVVSDATSYFDSPSTSSDELDTPPSTPPSSHVLLASTSTESLVISSESERIVSHKEPLGDTKLLYQRLRYRRLDFTKGGLGRDEQPLTFTFSV